MRDPATKAEMWAYMQQPMRQRVTIMPSWFWAIVLGAALAGAMKYVYAEPMAKLEQDGVAITVYTEDCQLKDAVGNLPKRATWVEGGKTYEGCVGYQPQLRVFMFYFEDKTVAAAPVAIFTKVTGA